MQRLSLILKVFLVFLLLSSCGKKQWSEYEAAQVEVVSNPNAYPFAVMVVAPGGRGICTGAFISPNAVLTAAHCTTRVGTYRVVTSFGTFSTQLYLRLGTATVSDTSDTSILIFSSQIAKRRSGQVAPIATQAELGEEVRLIGFGCDDLETRGGTGVKRTGVNTVVDVSDFIELRSPFNYDTMSSDQQRGILGPYHHAATCFGDSGGPLLRTRDDELSIVGICHAGGHTSDTIISQFININRTENLNFIHQADNDYGLGIFDYCNSQDPMPSCGPQSASMQIVTFIKHAIVWLKSAAMIVIKWLGI